MLKINQRKNDSDKFSRCCYKTQYNRPKTTYRIINANLPQGSHYSKQKDINTYSWILPNILQKFQDLKSDKSINKAKDTCEFSCVFHKSKLIKTFIFCIKLFKECMLFVC